MKPHNCSTINQTVPSKKNERLTLIVVIITLITMMVEIIAGVISGSMALLSDGIHMGTHALALFITLSAYMFARRHLHNPSFSFGTGKIGVLGGYTNAVLLFLAAAVMAFESVKRLIHPVEIHFNEAIIVAVIGLVINIISAKILGHGNDHHNHAHHHPEAHPGHAHQGHSHQDSNIKAAYLHVITDALTSVLAIIALICAKYFDMVWMDPAVGILGAIVVGKWAVGLLLQTSSVLLDKGDFDEEIKTIKTHLNTDIDSVEDLHIWQISDNERSLILSIRSKKSHSPAYYREKVQEVARFEHITIEITNAA